MSTQSHEAPAVRRWQDAYEVPVRVTHDQVSDGSGTREVWTYERLVIPSLTLLDVASAIERDFESDPDALAEASAAVSAALAG